MKSVLRLAAVALLAAACRNTTTPAAGGEVRVETLRGTYTREPSTRRATVTFRVDNGIAEQIFVFRCGEEAVLDLERREGGAWVQVAQPECAPGQRGLPLTIAPGESGTMLVYLREPGTYRLRVWYGIGARSAVFDRYSGAFTVS